MDDYIVLDIPRSHDQPHHIDNAILTGIYYVIAPDKYDKEDAISLKQILKKEAAWGIIKNVLGFQFDGNQGEHIIWFTEDCQTDILKSELGKESIEKGYPL